MNHVNKHVIFYSKIKKKIFMSEFNASFFVLQHSLIFLEIKKNSNDMLCALFLIDLILKNGIGKYFKNKNIFAQSLAVHFKEIVSTISNV